MTSVDSGVETGNDSNDSLSVQQESQQQQIAAGQVTSNNSVTAISPLYSNNEIITLDLDMALTERLPYINAITGAHHIPGSHEQMDRLQQIAEDNALQSDKLPSNIKVDSQSAELKTKMPEIGNYENKPHTERVCRYNRGSLNRYKLHRAKMHPHSSCFHKYSQLLKTWQAHHIGRKMRLAATVNNTMLMSSLLQSGVSPNSPDNDGRTPLHHAACRGYTKMVQMLLEHGADPNQRDCIGNTPLHLAAVTSKISVVTLLLTAGTNVLALDKYGYNPLQLAKAKIRMLCRNYNSSDMEKIKHEMHEIVNMLVTYLKLKEENVQEQVASLSNFYSRLSLSSTSDQVQDDVKDLLANIDSLSITG